MQSVGPVRRGSLAAWRQELNRVVPEGRLLIDSAGSTATRTGPRKIDPRDATQCAELTSQPATLLRQSVCGREAGEVAERGSVEGDITVYQRATGAARSFD